MSTNHLFAERLRELRMKAHLTQHELADLAGLHRQGIAKLETGVREPTWATVQALARALGVSCEAFTVDSTAPPKRGTAKKTPAPKPTKRKKK